MTSRRDRRVIEVMAALPVFGELNQSVLDQLEPLVKLVHVGAGTVIFSEGDTYDDLLFVSWGSVALNMTTARCGKQQILTVGRGDLLAWSTFLGDSRMTASSVATQDCQLLALSSQRLRQLCDANHDVGYPVVLGIANLISRRLLATRLQLLDVFHL